MCDDKHVILHMLLRSHAAISSNTGGKGAILTIGVTWTLAHYLQRARREIRHFLLTPNKLDFAVWTPP